LAESEEAMTVPVRSGHRLGDLGQAAIGQAVPGKALLEDHDPFEFAFPLTDKERAGLEVNAVSALRRPSVEGGGRILIPIGAEHPLNRPVETAEGAGLAA